MKKRKVLTGVLIASACLLTIGLVGQVSQNNGWFDGISQEENQEYDEYTFKLGKMFDDGSSQSDHVSLHFDDEFNQAEIVSIIDDYSMCVISSVIDLTPLGEPVYNFYCNTIIQYSSENVVLSFNFMDLELKFSFDDFIDPSRSTCDVQLYDEESQYLGVLLEGSEWTLRLYK